MGKRVQETVEIKLKPYERTVKFNSKQMYDDLSRRSEIINQGRNISKKIEELQGELAVLQTKLTKVDDKVKGYVATKFRPLLGATEDTREVVLQKGEVVLVIYDKVAEFAENVKKAHEELSKKHSVPVEEVKK